MSGKVSEPAGGETMAQSEYFFDFPKLFQALWRDIWLVIGIVVLTTGLAICYALYVATPVYQASASVVLDAANTDVADLPGEVSDAVFSETETNTQIAILLSEDLLARVADQLSLENDPEFNPFLTIPDDELTDEERILKETRLSSVIVAELREAVSARNVQRTSVLVTTAMTNAPGKSQQIANAMVDTYLAKQVERKIAAADSATTWLRDRVDELQRELIAAEKRLDDFGNANSGTPIEEGVTLRALSEQARAINGQYDFFLNRLTEALAQEGIYQPDGRILSYATEPVYPIAPRKRLIAIAGFLIGSALAFGLVSYRAFMTNKIRSRKSLEAVTNAPLLGIVPKTEFRLARTAGRLLQGISNRFTEAVDELRTNLMVFGRAHSSGVQVVASCSIDEGKTVIVQALARSYAAQGQSVLLVDADLRKRSLTQQIAPKAEHGIVSLTRCDVSFEDACLDVEPDGVKFLACETLVKTPIDVLYSEAFYQVLELAKEQFDVVLIDTAPVLAASDLLAFAGKAEVVLMVVRENQTSKRFLQDGLAKLRQQNIRVSGVVVNAVSNRALPSWRHVPYY